MREHHRSKSMSLMLVSDDGELVRLQALGKITGTPSPGERDPMSILLGPDGYSRKVLVDLEQAEYIDSAGIGWLLACHKRFARAGGLLVLHSAPDQFRLTFKMLKLDKVFQLADTHAESEVKALQGFRPSPIGSTAARQSGPR
jgi:anti-anti-sigma factor